MRTTSETAATAAITTAVLRSPDPKALRPTSSRAARYTASHTADRLARTTLLEALYRRYHDELRDYLLHLLQDTPLADDLAQQVFLHALTARRPIMEVKRPHAWLYRIASNLVTGGAGDAVAGAAHRPG